MDMDAEELERDRQIDPNELDLLAATQPDTFCKWAERAAAARSEMDRAKMQLELIEARLSLRCRDEPETFGLGRVTESGIHDVVRSHKSYIRAAEDLTKAKERCAMMDVAVECMQQRKRMIEILVTLHGQQYFAGPSVPRDLVSAWRERRDKTDKRMTDKQRRIARREREKVRG